MEKWIEILRAGKYPQGNVSLGDIQQMAESYDPNYQQALFIPEHRRFDEQGQLVNNMSALAWIKAVRVNGNALEVLVDDEDFLQNYYDGKHYKYASAEIETHTINNVKTKYLGAVAVTNFPASKIKQIKLNDEILSVYTIKIKKEDSVMNKEQFIQLCKALGIAEDSTPEVAITKLTEMQTALKEKGNDDLKAIADQLTSVIKLVKVEEKPADKNDNEAITKLTETVNTLLTRFDVNDEAEAVKVFDQAVKDLKVLPAQKEVLVGTKEKPGTFFKNAIGLQQFVSTLPALKLNSSVVIPKGKDEKPLTYSQLLKDPAAYQKMEKENPELLKALREQRFEEPVVEEKK